MKLLTSADDTVLYLVGEEHITIFSYEQQVQHDRLIWQSDITIGDVCLDDISHSNFISITSTEELKKLVDKLTTALVSIMQTEGHDQIVENLIVPFTDFFAEDVIMQAI